MRMLAENIVRRLAARGYKAYLAGGCVRDTLLGRAPKDFDVATSATPDEVQALFPKTVAVGAAFGVVIVVEGENRCEVATFRSDGRYVDGRRPEEVRYGGPEEDARRRDFTVNGLFLDVATGEVIDFVGGRADLEARVIRCIGRPEDRFAEDKLRLLRCVRLAGEFGFRIEERTWEACVRMAGQIKAVSAERIRDELTKILTAPRAGDGLDLLLRSGLLREILPECAALRGCPQPDRWHQEGDVFEHTRLMLNLMEKPGPVLAWAALLHDVGKPITLVHHADGRPGNPGHEKESQRIACEALRRLRFSNAIIEQVCECVLHHMQFKDVRAMRLATLKRMLARPTFETELELHRLDCLASHRKLDNYEFLKERQSALSREEIKPKPLVTGHDLMNLGFKPGPDLGRILKEIAEAQLDGRIATREEALEMARQVLDGAGQ